MENENKLGNAVDADGDLATIDPNSAKGINISGWQDYFVKGIPDQAIEKFSKAIGIEPNYAAAYNNRAIVYGSIGDKEKASAEYTKAHELAPDNVIITGNYNTFHSKRVL